LCCRCNQPAPTPGVSQRECNRPQQAALHRARRSHFQRWHPARRTCERNCPVDARLPHVDRGIPAQMNLPRLRLALSLLGVILALAAVATDDRRMTWAAIAVLLSAVVIRIIARRQAE